MHTFCISARQIIAVCFDIDTNLNDLISDFPKYPTISNIASSDSNENNCLYPEVLMSSASVLSVDGKRGFFNL